MTNGNDRLDRIEALLEGFVAATSTAIKASDERMTRIEQSLESSNERLTRIEQIVESNNRFLESFSHSLQQYATSMDNFGKRIDGIIAANNEQRNETNSRLASIQRQVAAISQHLGVE